MSKIYLIGGNKLDFTGGLGEVSLGTTYVLDMTAGTGAAVWAAKTALSGGELRSYWQPLFVNGLIYAFGGVDFNFWNGVQYIEYYYSTTQIYNIAGNSWAIDSTAGGPGAIKGYAAAADTTGGDVSGYWLSGGINGSSVKSATQKYTISPAAWGANIAGGPSRVYHGMAYVPGSVFSDGKPRLFIFGGSNTSSYTGGQNSVHCLNLTDGTWTNDTTSATAAGVAARSRHVWAYDATSKTIFLHGGRGTDGAGLSDIWEFNPRTWVDNIGGTQTSAWVNTSGDVVNVEDRFWHGGCFLGETLYLAGGSSTLNLFNSDLYSLKTQALQQYDTAAGIYTLKPSDGGNIRLMGAGVAQQATWQTPDFLGDVPTAWKHAKKARFDYEGDVELGVFNDNAAVQAMFTLTSATRRLEETWLPFSGDSAARAQRMSFRFRCLTAAAASSGVAGKVYSAEFDVVEEPGGF